MARKRREKPKKENKERWLLTYSDMITLLMIFFIIMYAMSKVDVRRFDAIASSLSKVMGGQGAIMYNGGLRVTPGVSDNSDASKASQANQLEQNNLDKIKKQIEAYLKENNLENKASVTMEDRGVVVSFQDMVLFPLGSAELSPESAHIVRQVGQILSQTPNYIRIEGHTDNLPIKTAVFPSNWELSGSRAARVVRELINSNQIPPERLSATGYGEYRPRKPNDVEANRRYNRRVDIIVMKNKFDEIEPGKK